MKRNPLRMPALAITAGFIASTLMAPVLAHAQGSSASMGSGSNRSDRDASELRSGAFHGNESVLGGPGYFTTAVGAGFAGGMRTDNTMINLTGGYNVDFSPTVTGKAIVDLNLGTGSDTARFIDLAGGANYFIPQIQGAALKPYVGADGGLGFVRNSTGQAADSLALGAGAGFQWLTDQTNVDVSLRYEMLVEQVAGVTPQILGVKLGMNY